MADTFVILFALVTLPVFSQGLEYMCRNATEDDFELTILLSYGNDCETEISKTTERFTDSLRRRSGRWSPFSVGLRLVDTCGKSAILAKTLTESVSYSRKDNDTCSVSQPTINIGFLTDMSVSGCEVGHLLSNSNIPLVVTSEVNYIESPEIITIGPLLEQKIKAMVNLMVALQWDYVSIIYSQDGIGRDSFRIIQNVLPKYHICMAGNVPANLSSVLPDLRSRGVVYIGSEGIGMRLLHQMSPSSDNVWVVGFNVRKSSNNKVYHVLRNGTDPLTDSVAYFEEALSETAYQLGCVEGDAQQCASDSRFHRTLLSQIRNRINERTATSRTSYNVYLNTAPQAQVASITPDLEVSPLPDFVAQPSLCTDVNCRSHCGYLHDDDHFYIHGDVIIIVAMEIHEKVDENEWWKCSGFSNRALLRTEAAVYALTYLNNNLDPRPGVQIGMLVMDSCGNGLKATGTLYDILRGSRSICDKKGECFDPTKVAAVVGDYSSGVAKQMQLILKEIPIIQLSYGASSIVFNNRVEYPYFLRTNPSDDLQAHFMVELLKKINKQPDSHINSVNLMYSEGLYAEGVAKSVKADLNTSKICVHMEQRVAENSEAERFTEIVNELIKDRNTGKDDVRLIIAVLEPEHIDGLMAAITARLDLWMSKGFKFVFSDTFNDDKIFLRNYKQIVKGSISFKFTNGFESSTFAAHLKSIHSSGIYKWNPWLPTIIAEREKCKIRGHFHTEYSDLCNSTGKYFSEDANEAYLIHLMKAITTIVYGLRSISYDQNSTILFDKSSIDKRYEQLLQIRIPETLEGNTKTQLVFTQKSDGFTVDGNGREGYTIYQIGDKDYIQLLQTGFRIGDTLNKFDEDMLTFSIKSLSDVCSSRDTDSKENPLMAALIALSVLIILIILGALICYLASKWQKREERPVRQVEEVVIAKPVEDKPVRHISTDENYNVAEPAPGGHYGTKDSEVISLNMVKLK